MNTNKITHITKILFILVLSFFVSSVINSEIFVGSSPLVRPNLPKYIALRINTLTSSGGEMLALVLNPTKREAVKKQQEAERVFATAVEKLKEKPLIPVSKGVYAQTDGETTIRTIKSDEIEKTEYTFSFQGKPLQIRVPAGLSKEDIEKTLQSVEKAPQ